MQVNSQSAFAARLRSINRLSIFGLGILAIGLVLSLGNLTKIFVTIPRLGLLVGAVGGAVMLLANLLLRRVTARAKARADKANLKPTGAGSAGNDAEHLGLDAARPGGAAGQSPAVLHHRSAVRA